MPEWIGKTIGKVRIEKLLARGGMAEVYLGTHMTLARPMAVKLLHSYIEEEPLLLERFQREARVVAGLRHPNIVQIFDFDTVDGHPFIVMEYLKGPTLATYLRHLHQRKKRSPHSQVAHLLNGLANALDYAHGRGVIHRDIKPANTLLDSKMVEFPLDKPLPNDVEAVVTDFGLVRVVDATSFTTVGMLSGTPLYMSPEQALGDEIDHRTDLYSLGIVLYEMLAGRLPFQADSTLTVLHMHAHATPPVIPGIPAKVQAVLDRALQKKPDDRYQTSRELANDFSRAIGIAAPGGIIQEPTPVIPVPIEPSVTVPPAPVSLPADLLDLLSHDNSRVRKLAVQELVELLDSKHPGLARAAQEKLREIADTDDSLTLRHIAAEELGARGFDADLTVPVEIPKEKPIEKQTKRPAKKPIKKPIEKPTSPRKDSAPSAKKWKDLDPLPRLRKWKPVLPKLERRFVGGMLGVALGVIFLIWASPLIVKGISGSAGTPTPTITPTPPYTLTSAPSPTSRLTQTSSPTSTRTLTATPTQTLTSTPTATSTPLPAWTVKPTRKPRDPPTDPPPPP